MAFGDWKFTVRGSSPLYTNGTLTNGEDGGPRINSSLSDPLTGSGDFCREYLLSSGNFARMTAEISSSVSGGLFTEVPNTKAISVRASLRSDTMTTSNYFVGIGAKLNEDEGSTLDHRYAPVGYTLVLGKNQTVTTNNKLALYMSTNQSGGTYLKVDMPGTYAANTWHHVRMDVTPVVTIQDRIEVYTGSAEGGSSWELVHTETVLNTDGHYVPWGETGEGEIGYFVGSQAAGVATHHIDNFEAYVVDV